MLFSTGPFISTLGVDTHSLLSLSLDPICSAFAFLTSDPHVNKEAGRESPDQEAHSGSFPDLSPALWS